MQTSGPDLPTTGQPRRITILGSTGSIGTQAIDVVDGAPHLFDVVALSAGGGNLELLAWQAVHTRAAAVGIAAQVPPDVTVQSQKGCLFTIADGVGGNRAGEVASSHGTQKLIETYYASAKKPLLALQHAFKQISLLRLDEAVMQPAEDVIGD